MPSRFTMRTSRILTFADKHQKGRDKDTANPVQFPEAARLDDVDWKPSLRSRHRHPPKGVSEIRGTLLGSFTGRSLFSSTSRIIHRLFLTACSDSFLRQPDGHSGVWDWSQVGTSVSGTPLQSGMVSCGARASKPVSLYRARRARKPSRGSFRARRAGRARSSPKSILSFL